MFRSFSTVSFPWKIFSDKNQKPTYASSLYIITSDILQQLFYWLGIFNVTHNYSKLLPARNICNLIGRWPTAFLLHDNMCSLSSLSNSDMGLISSLKFPRFISDSLSLKSGTSSRCPLAAILWWRQYSVTCKCSWKVFFVWIYHFSWCFSDWLIYKSIWVLTARDKAV